MSSHKPRSLNAQIKKEIGSRILICSLLLLAVIVGLTLFDLSSSFDHLRAELNGQLKPVEDFTIGEAMLNNPQAIAIKLSNLNQLHHSYQISWVPYKSAPPGDAGSILWNAPFHWEYNYQLGKIAGYQFGYFHVTGSLLTNKIFTYSLIFRALLLLLFLSAILVFLYPLANKIPKKLFTDPINHFLELLAKSDPEARHIPTSMPTELAALKNKIITLLDQAKEQERNELLLQMGKMTRQIAHDLNNYLFSLGETIRETKTLTDADREKLFRYLNEIETMAKRLLEKHRASNASQQTTSATPLPALSITSQLKKATALSEIKCAVAGIRLVTSLPAELYPTFVALNAADFRRLLLNLITNAIEAQPKSKKILIDLTIVDGGVSITIKDDGKGIPAAVLAKLGHAEVTFGKATGNGLGVSHAAKTVRDWGGDFSVDSTEGVGTTVTLRLPMVPAPAWFVPHISLAKVKQIVIVDDDPAIHEQWQKRFADAGIPIADFLTFADAHRFLADAPRDGSVLALVDYQISQESITGTEFLTQLQLQPIAILSTGRSDEEGILQQCTESSIKLLAKENIALVPIINSK